MASPNVPPRSAAAELGGLLDSPEIRGLISDLEQTRWTGRPGYPIRVMVGMALAKSTYAIPTWAKLVRLVEEHMDFRPRLAARGTFPRSGLLPVLQEAGGRRPAEHA